MYVNRIEINFILSYLTLSYLTFQSTVSPDNTASGFINAIIFQTTRVNDIKSSILDGGQFENNQNGTWKLDLGYYLHENVPNVALNLENVGQDTILVLLVQPQSSIFDKPLHFHGRPF